MDDPDAAWNTHQSSGKCRPDLKKEKVDKICMSDKCKTKLTQTNQFSCPSCLKEVCIKHRMEEDHACTKVVRNQQTIKSKLLKPNFFSGG